MQIDSGVKSNIIDDKTWKSIKNNGIKTIGEIRASDRKFKAYNQTKVIVMFDAEIAISDGDKELKTVSRFYVVENGPQPHLDSWEYWL